ncbi:hypothetical protein D3C75_959240 [compost metagenome]
MPDADARQRHAEGDQHQRNAHPTQQVDRVGQPARQLQIQQHHRQRRTQAENDRVDQQLAPGALGAGEDHAEGEMADREHQEERHRQRQSGFAEGIQADRQAHVAGVGEQVGRHQHLPVLIHGPAQDDADQPHQRRHQYTGQCHLAEGLGIDLGTAEGGQHQAGGTDIQDQAGDEIGGIGLP